MQNNENSAAAEKTTNLENEGKTYKWKRLRQETYKKRDVIFTDYIP